MPKNPSVTKTLQTLCIKVVNELHVENRDQKLKRIKEIRVRETDK